MKDSGGTTIAEYEYDALFRRVSETKSGTTTDFYYSAAWQVLEERVGGGNAKIQYVWSPVYADAMILRDRDADGNGSLEERLWVQQDANFNVTGLLDNTGTVVERYAYDPFGVQTVYDASWILRTGGSSYAFAFGFQGRPYDAVTGTIHFRRREYFPTLGRFGQLDPKEFGAGDQNFYRFESNGPANFLDPSGLDQKLVRFLSDEELKALGISQSDIDRLNKEGYQYAGTLSDVLRKLYPDVANLKPFPVERFSFRPVKVTDQRGRPIVHPAGYKLEVLYLWYKDKSGRRLVGAGWYLCHRCADGTYEKFAYQFFKSPEEMKKAYDDYIKVMQIVKNTVIPFLQGLGVQFAMPGAEPATAKSDLPKGVPNDLRSTLDRIAKGQRFPHRNDGSIFKNREGLLPRKPEGYYTEYVHPTPGVSGPGAQRVVMGKNGECYYTGNHYKSFIKVK